MIIAKRKHLLWGSLFLFACTHRSPQQRLADYINDPKNKITQEIKIGDIRVTAKWIPPIRNTKVAGNIKTLNPDQEDYSFFNVQFKKEVGEKPGNDKALYLDFDMQNDFTLYCEGDSIKPAICQKIENGMSGNYEYILAFDKKLDRKDFSLFYKDKIFGIGVVAFVYDQNDIRKIPGI